MDQKHPAPPQVPVLTVRQAFARLNADVTPPPPTLIDVREAWEFAEVRAQGAVNIPLSVFRERLSEVPQDRDVFFICHLGSRSLSAAVFAKRQGIASVFNVEGGTDAWEAQGLPIVRDAHG